MHKLITIKNEVLKSFNLICKLTGHLTRRHRMGWYAYGLVWMIGLVLFSAWKMDTQPSLCNGVGKIGGDPKWKMHWKGNYPGEPLLVSPREALDEAMGALWFMTNQGKMLNLVCGQATLDFADENGEQLSLKTAKAQKVKRMIVADDAMNLDTFLYDRSGRLLSIRKYFQSKLTLDSLVWDKNGHLLQWNYLSYLNKDIESFKRQYTYGTDGTLKTITHCTDKCEAGIFDIEVAFNKDSLDTGTAWFTFVDNAKAANKFDGWLKFDGQRRLIALKIWQMGDTLGFNREYAGNKASFTQYNVYNGTTQRIIKYEYNENGVVALIQDDTYNISFTVNRQGEITQRKVDKMNAGANSEGLVVKYKYNGDGLLKQTKTIYSEFAAPMVKEYSYQGY